MGSQDAWDPLKDLVQVQQRMNGLFENALTRTDFDTGAGIDGWVPVADVQESREQLRLSLELPGFEQQEIQLSVDGDHLIVEGERRIDADGRHGQFHRVERAYGKFQRRFPLPSRFDRERIQATYVEGLLEIKLRAQDSLGPSTFKIDIGEG